MPWSSHYQGIVENAPDALILIDAAGDIALINRRAETVFGYVSDELVGRSIHTLVPDAARERHQQDVREYLADPANRTMNDGSTSFGLRKDGTQFPVEVALAPLETPEGRFTMAAVRDITDRISDEQRFRDVLNSSPDPMVIVDARARIVLVNDQAVATFGYEREELLGEPIETLVPERYRGLHAIHRDGYLRSSTRREMGAGRELHAVRKDGVEFPVEISLSPMQTDTGTHVFASIRDITERKQIQAQGDRLRDELIATVSHELRTPLTSIIGYAELMADMEDDHISPPARRLLDIISRNANRELRLVDDLLTMAFLDDDRMQVNRIRVSLADITRAALEDVRVAAAEKGQTVNFECTDSCMVAGDPLRLEQAIENVLDNAVKFTPRGGHINVQVRDSGSMVLLEVEDTGMGVTEDEKGKLFERLYRTPGASAAQIQGAGLGLAIVKAIVDAHGGWIDVDSQVDSGSMFRISLPFAESVVRGRD